ncbi:MAG TPA: hypothetical protein VGL19_13620 [Polyangiaceae bacterium]
MLIPACQRKALPSQEPWAANRRAAATAVPEPEPLPLEAPVELLRVPNSGLPCAVDELLAAKCRRCHTRPTRHTAPFALLTWEDTQQVLRDRPRFLVMESAVRSGYMPYNIAANPPVERLSDAEKQIIFDWVAAGAPRATCGAAPSASASSSARAKASRAKPKPTL